MATRLITSIGPLYSSTARHVWHLFLLKGFTYSIEGLRSAIPALPLVKRGRKAFSLAIKL